eukprot:3801268-Pyramimonas_sp.AAC.1
MKPPRWPTRTLASLPWASRARRSRTRSKMWSRLRPLPSSDFDKIARGLKRAPSGPSPSLVV